MMATVKRFSTKDIKTLRRLAHIIAVFDENRKLIEGIEIRQDENETKEEFYEQVTKEFSALTRIYQPPHYTIFNKTVPSLPHFLQQKFIRDFLKHG